ncbi:MAG: tetratricopeptide repeat protein [Pseudomonadota bacterium]
MDRIIRTCSLIALAAVLFPAATTAKRIEPSAFGAYMRGRIADKAFDGETAVKSYSTALSLASNDVLVAFRAYRAGVDAGDYPLALRAARTLQQADILPPDARVLLYIGAVRDRNWNEARVLLDRIGKEDGFTFLAPLFDGWLSLATGKVATSDKIRAFAYVPESAALLAIARGDYAAGKLAVEGILGADTYRNSTLHLAAAATLASRKQDALALALLKGDDPSVVAARYMITTGGKMAGAVDSPARGTSFILQRMALDLMTERSARSAVTLARFATFADPESVQARLVAAATLNFADRHTDALRLVDTATSDPILADVAISTRIDLLEDLGRTDEAYALAAARAGRSTNDLTRLGDIEARRGNFAKAATHYRRAVETLGDKNVGAQLWLALGNVLDQGGDWKNARPALERALTLSPDDPRLLNQLGFGMADRGEDLDRALVLLKKASAAQPENAAITDSIGWAHFRAGNLDTAIETLERARGLDPAEVEITEHLGDAYWAAGRRIEARYAWIAAREAAKEPVITRLNGKLEQR